MYGGILTINRQDLSTTHLSAVRQEFKRVVDGSRIQSYRSMETLLLHGDLSMPRCLFRPCGASRNEQMNRDRLEVSIRLNKDGRQQLDHRCAF